MTNTTNPLPPKFIVIGKEVVKLNQFLPNRYKDEEGTEWALVDPNSESDKITRCGVYPFAIPTWPFFSKINEGCGPHDYMFSAPAYQAFHNRSEADEYLEQNLAKEGYPILGEIFEEIAEELGSSYWENEKTRDK